MDAVLAYADLQHYILVKLCFFAFIAVGLLIIYQQSEVRSQKTEVSFLLLVGLFSALGYFFLVHGNQLMFWGLKADEITIAAMYETFAHGSLLSDFAYANLPPFYPPLWFWIFGLVGRFMDWNGVQIAKCAAFVTILLFPMVFYFVQRWVFRNGEHTPNPEPLPNPPLPASPELQRGERGEGLREETAMSSLKWFLSSIFLFVVIDWDAIILKPYEFISAALVIVWTIELMNILWGEEIRNWKLEIGNLFLFGLTGGILFTLYYFWFFLVAIGIALFHLFYKKVSFRQYIFLFGVGAFILAVASPFWLPLARSYAAFGAENWQLGFLVPKWLATEGSFLEFSVRGLILFGGFLALIWFRRVFHIRVLLSLFAASYVWQIMGLVTILFFASPLQESKGFYFFNRAILAFAAAYGAARLWESVSLRYRERFPRRSLAILGLLLLSTQLIFGAFADHPAVMNTRNSAKSLHPDMRQLIAYLETSYDVSSIQTLHSSLTELHAFLPMNDVVYYNQHNSHPAALFS
ncbi:MAG: arabinofuranosyltransferase, partial [Patescibacteria group bacterium]